MNRHDSERASSQHHINTLLVVSPISAIQLLFRFTRNHLPPPPLIIPMPAVTFAGLSLAVEEFVIPWLVAHHIFDVTVDQ